MGTFDEALHPRAQDGKFGAGSGGPRTGKKPKGAADSGAGPGGVPGPGKEQAAKAPAGAKAKVAAARVAAKAKASAIVTKAKERAGALVAKAKAMVPRGAGGKAKVAAARSAAAAKAKAIVAAAKTRAKAIVAKAGGKANPRAAAKGSGAAAKAPAPAAAPTPAAKAPVSVVKAAPTASASSKQSDADLAGIAHAAAGRVAAGDLVKGGSAAFLSDVHAAMTPDEKAKFGGDLSSFKTKMEELSTGNHVSLARADTPAAHVNGGKTVADQKASIAKTEASDTQHRFGGRHFLELPEKAPAPAAAEVAPAPAGDKTSAAPAAASTARHMEEHEFDAARDSYAKAITNDEKQAALSYSSHHAVSMNRALRNGDPAMLQRYAKTIPDLDAALAKSTVDHDTLTFRGIAEDPKVFEHYASLKPGDQYVDKSYTSTSSSPFKQFSGAHSLVRLEITVPKGGKAAPIPSVKPQERELLLPRDQKFRVDRVEHFDDWEGKHIKVHVTALQE